MNKIIEEVLWAIYHQTSSGFGHPKDPRFTLLDGLIKAVHDLTGEQLTQKQLNSVIADLKKQKLIGKKKNYEDSVLVSLSETGFLRVLNSRFRRLNHKKEKWDGKWRMVAFDIPDSHRKGRNALRYRLKMGGFYEFQESIFLYPYDCKKEIDDFVKLFKLEKYVRFGLLDFIDIEDKLKFRFFRQG